MTYFYIAILCLAILSLVLQSPSVKGALSEKKLKRRLLRMSKDAGGKILNNIYVPASSGGTSEIDVLYITQKGLVVFENKNYGGYIFGNDRSKNWTVTLYSRSKKKVEKFQFYNPIWQNNTHVKNLNAFLGADIPMFSVISFSDRSELKDVEYNEQKVRVCHHYSVIRVLWDLFDNVPDVLTDQQIEDIYERLLPLTGKDRKEKEQHVQEISDRFESTEVCPVCGGKLVLRTAKSGANAGKQFYGCENYPKCRYIKNLE